MTGQPAVRGESWLPVAISQTRAMLERTPVQNFCDRAALDVQLESLLNALVPGEQDIEPRK